MIKSENARLTGWTFVDIERDQDVGSFVEDARSWVYDQVDLPPGYSIHWSGQYEYMLEAQQKLAEIIPVVLLIIFMLLYLIFKNIVDALLILLVLPFALLGSVWFIWWLGFDYSVAVAVGMIALAGVAAEFGVVMLLYIRQAITEAEKQGALNNKQQLRQAILNGAVKRVRPKVMTVSVVVLGLLPIMLGSGTGSEIMQRIAAPMVGGMISAPLVSLILIPVLVYGLNHSRLPASVKASTDKRTHDSRS